MFHFWLSLMIECAWYQSRESVNTTALRASSKIMFNTITISPVFIHFRISSLVTRIWYIPREVTAWILFLIIDINDGDIDVDVDDDTVDAEWTFSTNIGFFVSHLSVQFPTFVCRLSVPLHLPISNSEGPGFEFRWDPSLELKAQNKCSRLCHPCVALPT